MISNGMFKFNDTTSTHSRGINLSILQIMDRRHTITHVPSENKFTHTEFTVQIWLYT
jgi:hypothetical protein